MSRRSTLLAALAATACVAVGVGSSTAATPTVIGADAPVFLGRMVVSATALPMDDEQGRDCHGRHHRDHDRHWF